MCTLRRAMRRRSQNESTSWAATMTAMVATSAHTVRWAATSRTSGSVPSTRPTCGSSPMTPAASPIAAGEGRSSRAAATPTATPASAPSARVK